MLLLRDVLDRSVRETADTLGMSEANVKVIHHRARLALAPYEATREGTRPTAGVANSTAAALERLMIALGAGDEAALASVFAEGAQAWNDGGGEVRAARKVIVGASRVAKLHLGLARKVGPVERLVIRALNGVPMIVAERAAHEGESPRFVLGCDVDEGGRITRLYTVLATRKLAHVSPIRP